MRHRERLLAATRRNPEAIGSVDAAHTSTDKQDFGHNCLAPEAIQPRIYAEKPF